MKFIQLIIFFLFSCEIISQAQYKYPDTRTVDSADSYFGKSYPDPFRWMEDLRAGEVTAWFKAQNNFTDSLFTDLNGVDSFLNDLNKYNTSKTWGRGLFQKTDDRYYYFKGGRNQLDASIYYKKFSDSIEHLVLNSWAIHPGMRYDLMVTKFSPDNNYLLIGLDKNGEEYPFLKVYDCKNEQWLPDSIPHCWENTVHWTADSKGFIYGYNTAEDRTSADAANFDIVKYHTLFTDVKKDITVMNDSLRNLAEKKVSNSYYAAVFINQSKRRIYCQPNQGFEFEYSNIYYCDGSRLKDNKKNWKILYHGADSVYQPEDVIETADRYYFVSAKGNGFKSVRSTSFQKPDFANAEMILPESKDWQVENIRETRSYLLINYSKYGFLNKTVFINKTTGRVIKITALDSYDRYSVYNIGNNTDECFVRTFPVNRPNYTLRFNIAADKLVKDNFWAPQNQTVLDGWEDIVSELIEVPSFDGALVPLTIMRNKNTKLDGSAVCILNGYGAYGIGTKDNTYNTYNPAYSLLVKRNVILAHAYVRGGGEKGESWHAAGMKENKPNSWKDFIACAEYLIKNKYSSPAKLGCTSGSAGGILIGRAVTERPDLFGATYISSGTLNTIRTNVWGNGVSNYPEFGNPGIESEMKGLIEMDAVLHVKPGVSYPAVYITAGMNDTRVAPWMSGKFVASLQANSTSNKPVLLHTNFEGGHFGDANAASMLDYLRVQLKDIFFILWQCGHTDFQKK